MKPFIIDCGAYPFDVLVYFGENKEPMYKAMKGILSDEAIEQAKLHDYKRGYAAMHSGGQMILWLEKPPTTPSTIATLAHECLHIVFLLFDRIGIPISEENCEASAYMIDYLVNRILIEYNRLESKRRPADKTKQNKSR